MVIAMCNHNIDKNTTLKLLPKFKYFGVLKQPKIAICIVCGKNIKLTDEEYNMLRGDSDETNI